TLFFRYRIKSVVDKIEHHTTDVLRNDIYYTNCFIKICLQGNAKGFVFCTQAMVGESHILIKQCINHCAFLNSAAASAVLEHTFHYGIGTLAMLTYFFLVIDDIARKEFCFL